MSSKLIKALIPLQFVLFIVCISKSSRALQESFYEKRCPGVNVLSVVKDEVTSEYKKDQTIAPALLRLHFHDCFVRGCDASVLIDSTPSINAEKSAPPNNPSLRGFEVIDDAKNRLESMCKGIVSCADIIVFAARDSVLFSGAFEYYYEVPAGRRDGKVSLASEALTNLPPPTLNVNQLIQAFAKKGFSQDEMVTLSGAHTLGRAHCTSFSNRLYNFSTGSGQDPTLDSMYAARLKDQCPKPGTNPKPVVFMDPETPALLDVNYYSDILTNKGLFTSDQTLLTNQQTKAQVIQNANNQFLWSKKFVDAMVKMGCIGVLTGREGEIRANCRVVNE
ncbi:Peroxidase 3 [Striga hermonthica]|uniref:Peroxidase n=1 Tax=Striga hermonthica TaxID=68872 RepID=A0A9N7N798_STRHE|nr:Peroxidase 3 [Striga hermonthica]